MSDDEDRKTEERQDFWTMVSLGTAAALGAVWWLTRKGGPLSSSARDSEMTEDEVAEIFRTADPMTPEGRRTLARAQTAGAIAERRRRGEEVDQGMVALEQMRAQSNWDWSSKGERFLGSIENFEKAVTRPLNLDPADLRKDRKPHYVCPVCQGAGNYMCPRCRGRQDIQMRDFYGHLSFVPCPECAGVGTKVCETCHGRQVIMSR